MCGICGILNSFPSQAEQKEAIVRLTAPLQHRGPDSWGTYLAPGVALGHTRLSIIDLNTGQQPMAVEQYVIVFNGEIYNYIELRAELVAKGITFTTHSDTEVLLRLFEVDGAACFSKLNGQFALLIWDRRLKTLTAARDRYGVRPLFILLHQGRYYFSSEMKSFDTLPGFARQYAPESVFEHAVLWNTLAGDTVYKGIRCVEAGCFETFALGSSPRRSRYYEVGQEMGRHEIPQTLAEATEQFTSLLQDSVDLRLRSDVPVGTYLSGGIDSSAISYLARKNKQDDFRTFSIEFEDPAFDESRFQHLVSSQLGAAVETVRVSTESIEQNFLDAIYHIERPVFRTAPVPLFLLAQRVRQCGFRVVLTGEGADEILFGYDSFKELRILEQWKKEGEGSSAPDLIKDLYPHLQHFADPQHMRMLRMYYQEFLPDFDDELCGLNIRVNNNRVIASFLNRDLGIKFDKGRLIERLRAVLPPDFSRWTLLQRNSFLEIRTLLDGYLLSSQGDRMSLAHGVEGRYPFLDPRVVEAAFSYPDDFKLNGFSQKHLLREAFRGKLPVQVLDRPKQPYNAPDLRAFWRNGSLTECASHFLSPEEISKCGLFDTKSVARFLRKFETGLPEQIGYRDNMIITFLLSSQMALHWARTPKPAQLDPGLQCCAISDY